MLAFIVFWFIFQNKKPLFKERFFILKYKPKYNKGKHNLTNYIDRVDKICMVKYDKVCNNIFKDSIRHKKKDSY